MSDVVVLATEAVFFGAVGYHGDFYTYSIDDGVVEVTGSLNDTFRSVRVGEAVKVLAWQHYSFGGNYAEWSSDQPNITSIGGLSVFKIVPRDTRLIMARFTNATDSGRAFAMKVNTAGSLEDPTLGERWLAEDDPNFHPIGLAFADGRLVTTALYVRDTTTFVYNPIGSCYFRWNADSDQIDIDQGSSFPSGMACVRENPTEFTFTLTEAPAQRRGHSRAQALANRRGHGHGG